MSYFRTFILQFLSWLQKQFTQDVLYFYIVIIKYVNGHSILVISLQATVTLHEAFLVSSTR